MTRTPSSMISVTAVLLAVFGGMAIAAQDNVTAFRKENGIGDMNTINNGTEVQALDTLHQKLLETQNLRRTLEAKRSQSDEAAPTSKEKSKTAACATTN